jgi:cysteine-rich repeat protein
VYVVVSGSDATQAGAFTILMGSHATVCGDGIQDPTEECEDLNTTSGDGCSAQCQLEATEVEPNGTVMTANVFTAPFFAAISPAGDVDVVAVTIPSEPSTLIVETVDLGSGACVNDDLDSYIEVLDASGTNVVGSDDDSGIGLCAQATVSGLPAGTVYVRVRTALGAPAPTFSYRLDVTIL